jgi:glycosyltransferase involved in cell wall biosynthesis
MTCLRVVIVNHCHPAMPHVCATRAREFAGALAREGHRVVLLTSSLHADDRRPAFDVESHDWTQPYAVGCPPAGHGTIRKARAGALPTVIGKATLAANYLTCGHVFGDWVAGARPVAETLGRVFRPNVVWGIFGNTGAWTIAQGMARAAGCLWVMDIKDSWPRFVPAGLRRIVAAKFHNASAVTALSRTHAAEAAPWFGPATVVYSGVPAEFLQATTNEPTNDVFDITLTGSVYEAAALGTLVQGLVLWLREDLDDAVRRRVRFRYFGTDTIVRDAAVPLRDHCRVELAGFVPLTELRRAQRAARLNVYTKSPEVPFHHKVFELLSAGRPVLCVPGEGEEGCAIAKEAGSMLFGAGDAQAVQEILGRLWRATEAMTAPVSNYWTHYTWDAQAKVLAQVLADAAGRLS